jgi:AraC-like DNA-binding protein
MVMTPPAKRGPRVQELADAIRSALLQARMQGKVLASAMGLSESHLSRQLNQQGVNVARLLDADVSFWQHFLKPLTELAGLTRDQVLEIFGADAGKEAELEKRIAELERRDAERDRQLAEVLKRLPPPSEDSAVTRVA